MFWGISPALDLQEELCTNKENELNVLLVGQADARHILKTLAHAYRHPSRIINFYVIEGTLELIARQLLLLSIAFESPEELGALEKAIIFMEVYGNILVRPGTAQYISNKSRHLVQMVTDSKLSYLPIINLDELKYKERDYIETVLKFWEKGSNHNFNICKSWDNRLRSWLGVRYDARKNIADWDYHMRLRECGVKRVGSQEYKHFRETGISFLRGDCEGSKTNLTLAAGVIESGIKYAHGGYLGDIVTGPFLTYGLSCEDEDMLKTQNAHNVKRSTDIAERNLRRIFHELEHRETYQHVPLPSEEERSGFVVMQLPDFKLATGDSRNTYRNDFKPPIQIENASIRFLSITTMESYPARDMLNNHFDVVYIANNMLKNVRCDIMKMIADDALFLFETRCCAFSYQKDKIRDFENNIHFFAEACNLVQVDSFDPLKDFYAKFIKSASSN